MLQDEPEDDVPFALTAADKASACWARLKDELAKRLHNARCRNDGDLNEIQTANLRGRIKELESIIAFEKEPPTLG